MRDHGRGCALTLRAQRERFFTQRIVGAPGMRNGDVGVAAGPGFDAGVEVHGALGPAKLDQRDGRYVHRHVEHEIAAADVFVQLTHVVVARECQIHEFHAIGFRHLLAVVVRGDDGDAFLRNADVAQHQGQGALADAAVPDENDASRKFDVNLAYRHG
jgi:hypothetical protein